MAVSIVTRITSSRILGGAEEVSSVWEESTAYHLWQRLADIVSTPTVFVNKKCRAGNRHFPARLHTHQHTNKGGSAPCIVADPLRKCKEESNGF